MSFLIDDILKETTTKKLPVKRSTLDICSTTVDFKRNFEREFPTKPATSILEYTLSQKNMFGQCNQESYNNKYQVHYDPVRGSAIGDSYLMKATGTGSLYGREQVWPPYMPYSMMFNCAHLHTRRKGGQVRFTASQTEELEKQFCSHKYLSPEDRRQLANFLRLSDRQVKTWFQNRRAKWRRNSHPAYSNTETSTLRRESMNEFTIKNSHHT